MDIKEIKELLAALDASKATKLEYQTESFTIKLEKSVPAAGAAAPAAAAPTVSAAAVPAAVAAAATDTAAQAEAEPEGNIVTSPLVGTFYASSAPDKPAFATVGKTVKKGDTLFIVESMKLMNEVASEFDGTVAEILVKNGAAVEYGQPVMRIE
jgi:acetyl-CoA carboxylase biotin carboxyl carrier protein